MPPLDFGREHPDPLADALSPLVLDRQRIVQSAAFRRLQHKTQVFVAPESDHFRTRLTHTLEVAHTARLVADRLHLNAGLAEVVALAHDLGHPPFGHAGEKALNECLKDDGGFEHNRHTLRIVEYLEHPYPDFYGLNLTRAVRACLAKHSTPYDAPGGHPLQAGRPPPAECFVVDFADRLTYALHDLQDGVYADLLAPGELSAVELCRSAFPGAAAVTPADWRRNLRGLVDRIQQRVLMDLAPRGDPERAEPLQLAATIEAQLQELERVLFEQVYRSEALIRADDHARRILAAVFDACMARPDVLPPRFRRRVDQEGVARVVGDYVAGMTDRYCIQELARLSDRTAS